MSQEQRRTIEVDGREIELTPDRDLLTACLEQGIEIPHFCWHGGLGSVGACRLCAVTVYDGPDDREGRLEMSCMTAAQPGQRVSVHDARSSEFRARVIEWLMVNHPHDCAVCEEGGNCHLQDMTVATGHVYRRHRFVKRTHRNQYLGPFLTHQMNRCIACYRCTRFYRDYAGGSDLNVFGSHERVYFGRVTDGVLENPFAGNVAELCPTGVFNDKGWSQDYAREWDMRTTPSVCPHCATGCNLFLSERHGRLRRVTNRYHGELNGYFICDRGRFGTRFTRAPARLTHAYVDGAVAVEADAVAAARAALARGAVALGSPRASLEANHLLARLAGNGRFFAAITDAEAALVTRIRDVLAATPARIASLRDIEGADAVLVLGEQLTGTAPRAALAVRQAARGAELDLAQEKGVPRWLDAAARIAGEGRRSPIMLVGPAHDALEDVASHVLRRTPDAVAAFAAEVADALRAGDAGAASDAEAREVVQALLQAQRPLVIAGAGLAREDVVDAAAAIADALGERSHIALFPPEANSLGLALLGASPVDGAPGPGLGARRASGPDADCVGIEGALAALQRDPALPLVVLEADLFERAPVPLVTRLLAAAPRLIVLDHLTTATSRRADICLPVASFAEAAGTFINYEGRAQRWFAAVAEGAPAAWRRLVAIAPDGALPACLRLDDVIDDLVACHPHLTAVRDAAPGADAAPDRGARIARAPARFSGRTASDEAGRVAAGVPAVDPDGPLAFTMEGRHHDVAPALLTSYRVPGLHSASAAHTVQATVGGPLRGGDPGAFVLGRGRDGVAAPPPRERPHAPADDADRPLRQRHAAPAGEGLVLVPLYDPFRGDETSRASPMLAERAPKARLALHPADAQALGLAPGHAVRIDGSPVEVDVVIDEHFPRGHAGLSAGPVCIRGAARRILLEPVPSTS